MYDKFSVSHFQKISILKESKSFYVIIVGHPGHADAVSKLHKFFKETFFENIERYLLSILDFLECFELKPLKQYVLSFRFLLALFSIEKVFMLKIINY